MLASIAGCDRNDTSSSRQAVREYLAGPESIKGLRIGLLRELNNGLTKNVEASFKAALGKLEELGAIVEEVSIPSFPAAAMVTAVITWAEAVAYHQNSMREPSGDYGDDG